jgi:glutathione synthase/RimK-type ligase-like ATP-grasp enzyme
MRRASKVRLLVLRAGSPSTNNLIRSLKAGDRTWFIVGCDDDAFTLRRSLADRNVVMPDTDSANFPEKLHTVIRREGVDLVIPNSERDVIRISKLRAQLMCRTFLPRKTVIERCCDKYALTQFLARHGLPVPETYLVESTMDVGRIFRRFRRAPKLWCRIRRGSGSFGATAVRSSAQARSWIEYWQEMQRVRAGSFTLSEFLPGRDLTVQCLFQNGSLIAAKMYERRRYHLLNGVASGVSSTAALAKMLHEPSLLDLAVKAILCLDRRTSGVYFVDLKEDEHGKPRITEINAGRFANVPTIHDAVSTQNIAAAYVRAALGQPAAGYDAVVDTGDCYVMRGLDMPPAVLRGRDLFRNIRDLR